MCGSRAIGLMRTRTKLLAQKFKVFLQRQHFSFTMKAFKLRSCLSCHLKFSQVPCFGGIDISNDTHLVSVHRQWLYNSENYAEWPCKLSLVTVFCYITIFFQ